MASLALVAVVGECSPQGLDRVNFQLNVIKLQPELVISGCLNHKYSAVLCSVLDIKIYQKKYKC